MGMSWRRTGVSVVCLCLLLFAFSFLLPLCFALPSSLLSFWLSHFPPAALPPIFFTFPSKTQTGVLFASTFICFCLSFLLSLTLSALLPPFPPFTPALCFHTPFPTTFSLTFYHHPAFFLWDRTLCFLISIMASRRQDNFLTTCWHITWQLHFLSIVSGQGHSPNSQFWMVGQCAVSPHCTLSLDVSFYHFLPWAVRPL